MKNPYQVVLGYQTEITNQWLSAVLKTFDLYASLLDPRPDLSVPARSVKHPYAWWW
jgi:hypothetical protein